MPKINKVLAGALCALALLGAGCSAGTKGVDQSSPEAVTTAFMNAIKNHDKASAQALAQPGSDMAQHFDEGWADISRNKLTGFTIKKVDGNTVNVETAISIDGESRTRTNGVQVIQKDGKWWVVDL
ncbi:MAG: hypothetical protein WC802_03840 [Patescibacteria group bacterium]|jgi:uncharacterized membrane protein YvbJ